MAHLERHGDGWRVVWREAGKRRKSTTLAPKRLADAELAAIEARQAAQGAQRTAIIPWGQLVERWAIQVRGGDRHRDAQRRLLLKLGKDRDWHHSGDVQPAQVQTLDNYYHGKAVRALLRFAQLLDQPVDARACRMLPPPPRRKPVADLLTAVQVADLIAEAGRWSAGNAAIAHLVATYGHRPENVVRLTGAAIDGDHLTLTVKGGDVVRHPLIPATLAILAPLNRGKDAPLFLSHMVDDDDQPRPWRTGNEFAGWWWHCVGAELTPKAPGIYHLKRYAISRMLAVPGMDMSTVASITGHRTPTVLLRYLRTNEDRQRTALSAIAGPGDTQVTPTKRKNPARTRSSVGRAAAF